MSRRWTAGSAGELATLTAVGLLLLVALGSAALPWIMPSQDEAAKRLAALLIFAASYLALAIGKVPGLSIDRAGVALVGACLMVASGVMTLDEAYQSIDLGTITLLLGMMTSWPICGSPASSRCSTRG
jgi:di/tricarboxylate transporter